MAKILSKGDILKASDIQTEEVDVSAWWGGSVLVRGMTGAQRDRFEFEQSRRTEDGRYQNLRARWCAECIVDEGGKPVFDAADVETLGAKNGAALDKVFDAALRLSGIGAKAAEIAAKNLTSAPSGASTAS